MKNLLRWALLGIGLAATSAHAGPLVDTTLYFTNYSTHQIQYTVANYTGDGTAGNGTFSLTAPTVITTTPGADGIVRNPNNGNLLIGGQGNAVYQVNPGTGTYTTATPGVNAFHLAVDPSKNVVWASGIPGALSSVPINPFGAAGTVLPVHTAAGSLVNITSLAFTPSNGVFFTDAGPGGTGDFGSIDLSTGIATIWQTGVVAAHGMVYDPFSGYLVLGGGDQIAQIDPSSPGSIYNNATFAGNTFDQGAVDGLGHIFWADNGGKFFFMDYSTTSLVGSANNFISDNLYQVNLDDIAPLIGAGGTTVPEPATLALVGVGLLGLGFSRRRKRA